MAIPVKRKVKILKAQYVKETDSILFIGECPEGRVRHQINSTSFTFGAKNKEEEMEKTAKLMVGKTINIVFDPDLMEKIKDHHPLKY
jgi:hypothetical protein